MDYEERLHVPLRWWAQGTMLVASLWLAVVVALPPAAAWTVTALAGAAVATGLVAYGAPQVAVSEHTFRAGRATIDRTHVGGVVALDPEATRRTAGVDADARAYLMMRPYLKRAVRVEITDPDDPVPYWLVSTRRPDQLARALGAVGRV